MKLTKNSQLLINFFNKNKTVFVKPTNNDKRYKDIIEHLYDDIMYAHASLQDIIHLHKTQDKTQDKTFYKLQINKITSTSLANSQIIKPKTVDTHFFPQSALSHIDNHSMYTLIYTFALRIENVHVRNIKIIFTIENNINDINKTIIEYNKYIEYIYMWLHILNTYSSNMCAQELTIYLYFSSLNKELPHSHDDVIDVVHVNTAFTTSCSPVSEIVIYRKEEWFKVLMHETFHNFGLDFSDMDNSSCSARILKLFPVKSKVNLYESYCEFWAETMNALFCSFRTLTNKYDFTAFLFNFNKFINLEINYSLFQLVKTLNFMGLKYEALHSNKEYAKILRDKLYKENTNVLAYYVIKTILIANFQTSLDWFNTNNTSLLQFKKTAGSQHAFCELIERNYNSANMQHGVSYMQQVFHKLNARNNYNNRRLPNKSYKAKITKASRRSVKARPNHNKKIKYIMNNLRMTLCELG